MIHDNIFSRLKPLKCLQKQTQDLFLIRILPVS